MVLKIDVDTLRGTLEGVPRLAELLTKEDLQATFLFSLGPDRTGLAIKRIFRPGFLNKVGRTSVLEHYGWKTLLYGTLLPAPDIAARAEREMRQVQVAGFEVGIHTYDHVKWQDGVVQADRAWTEREMRFAYDRFHALFGIPARIHGAAGWQMNAHALRYCDALKFSCSSDSRGRNPFFPCMNGEQFRCIQIPTTLATMDELTGVDGMSESDVVNRLLQTTQTSERPLEGYTLHAELEGQRLLPQFHRLLSGWRDQGFEFVTLGQSLALLDLANVPHCEVFQGIVPGRSGTLLCQGSEITPQ